MIVKWVDALYNQIRLTITIITMSLIGQDLILIIQVINIMLEMIYRHQAVGVVLVAGRRIGVTCSIVISVKHQEITTQSNSYLRTEEHLVPEDHHITIRDQHEDTLCHPRVIIEHSRKTEVNSGK